MTSLKTGAAALVLFLGLGLQASAQHAGSHGNMTASEMQKMMKDMQPTKSDSPSTRAYKEAHMKMMKAMHVRFSGEADVDFVRNMIPHHQGAIDMAEVELAHGKDPKLKEMANKIIVDQKKEISEMQDWLKRNNK